MRSNVEKIRRLFVILLTLCFVVSTFSVIYAKPNKQQVEDFAISEEGEEDDEEDEEEKLTPEQIAAQKKAEEERLAALKKKKETLEKEVEKLGNDNKAISELLNKKDNQEAIKESAILVEKKLNILLNEKKLNYSEIGSLGKILCSKDKDSSIGLYAQGLEAMNRKKPNLKQALQNFDKARKANNPYKDAASAYNSCWLKSNLVIVIVLVVSVVALIAFGVVFALKKIKEKKNSDAINNTEIDLQQLLNEEKFDSSENEQPTNETQAYSNELGSVTNHDLVEDSQIVINKPNQDIPETYTDNNVDVSPVDNQIQENDYKSNVVSENIHENVTKAEPEIKTLKNNQIPSNQQLLQTKKEETEINTPVKKVVRVVKKVRVRKDANGNTYVVSEETTPVKDDVKTQQEIPSVSKQEKQPDLDTIKNITKPSTRPTPPVDSAIDQIWDSLSRKAMEGHIDQMVRKQDRVESPFGNSNTYRESIYNNQEKDYAIGDVSIDLSEDALKDDLIGKLKMMAITDSELRELFALKNPAHIPYLIEYVMTKPEPMRLAFVAKEIGNYADPAVVDVLSSLLYHEDERVVLAAIQGLEATKLPDAIVPLCPFLRSETPLFAQAARTALSKFGAIKIMHALEKLPTFTDIKLKEAGIFVLSRMRGEPVENILKSLLNDDSSEIRIQAILAMSYQKNPVYIETLREFYRSANDKEKSMTRKAIVYLNGFKS